MRVNMRLMMAVGLILAMLSTAGPSGAQIVTKDVQIKLSPLTENVRGGQIDWGTEMMYASGEGSMPSAEEEPNRGRAFLRAKEYAKMAAIANLFQLIEGTSISYSATGRDFMAVDVLLKQTIEGYVKNVNVVRTISRKEEGDTTVKVTVGTPIYGRDTPGQALLAKLSEVEAGETPPAPVKLEIKGEQPKVVEPEMKMIVAKVKVEGPGSTTPEPAKVIEPQPLPLEQPKEPEPAAEEKPNEPEPAVVTPPAPDGPVLTAVKDTPPAVMTATTASAAGQPHTSVIVDTLGYNVMRAMSPKIRAKSGDEVWGTLKMDPDEVQDHGPVAYTRSVADAKKCSRAGSNPLLLKAIGRAGGSRMCDVVLSDEDVAKLKASDQASKPPFLAGMKVVLVVDPTKAF